MTEWEVTFEMFKTNITAIYMILEINREKKKG